MNYIFKNVTISKKFTGAFGLELKYSLSEKIKNELILLAQKYDIQKIILFGSRARCDNKPTSDIDLAVSGGDVEKFKCDIDDEIETLLMFDIVNLDELVQFELLDSINREGKVIYEKV